MKIELTPCKMTHGRGNSILQMFLPNFSSKHINALHNCLISYFCTLHRTQKKNCEMCLYENFCFFCNINISSQVIAIFSAISGLLNLISGVISLTGNKFFLMKIYSSTELFQLLYGQTGLHGISFSIILISLIWIITDALLVFGIAKNSHRFMIPWLVIKMIYLLVSCLNNISIRIVQP